MYALFIIACIDIPLDSSVFDAVFYLWSRLCPYYLTNP